MSLPPKIAGGHVLDCGHQQVVGAERLALASSGQEQHPVWCVECEDWTRLAPFANEEE